MYNYFTDKNKKEYTQYTKEEIWEMVDVYKPKSFIFILEALDIPYWEEAWNRYRDNYIKKYPSENPSKMIGKYISYMKLPVFKSFGFKDSYKLNESSYIHIILDLLAALEKEHTGLKKQYINFIYEKYHIDLYFNL